MRTIYPISRPVALTLLLFVAFAATIACNQPPTPTFTPAPVPTPLTTATPTQTERVTTAVREVFEAQVQAIRQGDWATVYTYCSPGFRQLRTADRFAQDAASQFRRDGYTTDGFEARNVRFSVRSPDRVRVSFDAYQDGAFIRSVSVGQDYTLLNGRWWDDGMWCKVRVGA